MQTPSNPDSGIMQELRDAQALVARVQVDLENQRQLLKQRAMNLPPLVKDKLNIIGAEFEALADARVDEQTELGQLRALADMSAGITTSLDVDTVLEDSMDIVIALTRAERGYIILLADDGSYQYRVRRDNTLKPDQKVDPSQSPEISTTIVSHVLDQQTALLADNAFQDERLLEGKSVANFSLRSVLCVPLMYKDQAIGVVYVDNRLQAGIFTEREKQTLTAFANTAAVAITNASYYAEIQRALAEITHVKDLMDNVFSSIGSGLIATNSDDIITTFNRAAEQILTLAAEQTVGQPLAGVLPKITADLSDHLTHIRDVLTSEVIDVEMPKAADGTRVALQLKLSPLRDTDEAVRGVAIVMDDVTEKREREQQLRTMKTYLPPEMVDQIHAISQLALGGVRREVTCLFAEVRSLSTMGDATPTQVMEIINTYLSVAAECVTLTGGVVDKYMGTEVMALWNTQLNPHDDHARRALDCALLMRERFLALYAQAGIQPDPHWYRVGIHSGVATMGNVGSIKRRDFTAIGDTINLSKRIEENASSGQIVISEATLDTLRTAGFDTAYRLERLAPIQAKGKSRPTQVYEVFKQDD